MSISFVENRENFSDEELVRLINSGKYELLRVMISRYTPLIRSIAVKTALQESDVDDLTQEGLIALYSAVNGYTEQRSSFSTFVTLCVKRAMIDFVRVNTRKKRVPQEMCSPLEESAELVNSKSAECEFIEKESLKNLTESIRVELSEFEYKVLTDFLSGSTYTEIANANSVSVKSVDNALKRIRQKLKNIKNI